ncbi:PREDICTED: zona pellucida sperm-binding protein 1 [Condylura cristata]|uniref:zona pellucida sperm-binding protein 1 n=1 Tax=Condylura cristata TaxID=143302 RepID=UPI000642ED71|nr:PREDICTED: zona pellucida sperm-binding protein 1 [Condylura cristata]
MGYPCAVNSWSSHSGQPGYDPRTRTLYETPVVDRLPGQGCAPALRGLPWVYAAAAEGRSQVMAWGHCVALLLLLPAATLGQGQQPHSKPGPPRLRYRYDCGSRGMQLLVYPPPGRTVHFKAMDEFGNLFEVNNCSICYHWVTSTPQGPTVLSAEYKGCHVLEKEGRFHLRVSIEVLLPSGRVAATRDVTMTCPQADLTSMPGPRQAPLATSSLSTPSAPLATSSLSTPSAPLATSSLSTPSAPLATSSLSTPSAQSLHPASHRTLPSPPYPELSVPQPASPSPGAAPTYPTPTQPQWSTWELWEGDSPAYAGTHLTPDQCQVASGHIPCQVRSSKAACQQAGCCYDKSREMPCYYGNTVTVQCFRSGYVVLVVSQETALAHRVSLDNIRLAFAPRGCARAQETGSFVAFRFPLTHCGTTLQVVGDQLIYENQLVSDPDVQVGPQGSITRDGTFQLLVRCVFNTSDFLPIQASILPALPPSSSWPTTVSQAGPLPVQLRVAKDASFSSYYREGDYPIVRLLRQPVHVEVRLLQRVDPSLVLVLHQCWATPSVNPFEQPQWTILSDGCPFKDDAYKTQMVPVDEASVPVASHYQRFTVATFTLLDPQRVFRKQVYFFCSVSVCVPSGGETCLPSCRNPRLRRSSSSLSTPSPQNIVSSPGPVSFEDPYRQEPALGHTGSPSRSPSPQPLLWVLLLLLAVTLALGTGVFVGLKQVRAQKLRDNRG